MNLNSNPTIADQCALFAAANDSAGHHVLWVDNLGEVHLSCIPTGLSPAGFERSQQSMKVRYETFQVGNGYVGQAAAADLSFMGRIFSSLQEHWPSAATGVDYVDHF